VPKQGTTPPSGGVCPTGSTTDCERQRPVRTKRQQPLRGPGQVPLLNPRSLRRPPARRGRALPHGPRLPTRRPASPLPARRLARKWTVAPGGTASRWARAARAFRAFCTGLTCPRPHGRAPRRARAGPIPCLGRFAGEMGRSSWPTERASASPSVPIAYPAGRQDLPGPTYRLAPVKRHAFGRVGAERQLLHAGRCNCVSRSARGAVVPRAELPWAGACVDPVAAGVPA